MLDRKRLEKIVAERLEEVRLATSDSSFVPPRTRHIGIAAEIVDAIWPEVQRLLDHQSLADYDLQALNHFKGERDKVLRYWALRAITAENQLKEAGIERTIPMTLPEVEPSSETGGMVGT